ncbi:hypothetical protein [Gemmatimonas sp.]|uniref:hypothetical protein n=1 Tax=Gemmatimonas sp. TaxID=1962908 RepID=UPI003565D318
MRVSDLDQWSSTLTTYLSHHIDAERDALSAYQTLEHASDDTLVAHLVRSIIADETRHHQLFVEMHSALATGLVDRNASPLAHLGDLSRSEPGVRELTEQLLKIENEDLRELGELRHRLGEVVDTRRWIPLVEMMELDTKKHIKMLSFILDLT